MPSVVDWTLSSADVFDFEMSVELADTIELFQQEGVTAGATGNQSTFSRVGIGGGKNAETLPRKSPDSQAMNNDWAGMCWAQRENVFVDADGVKYRVSDLTLTLPGQYLVADFDTNYHRFDYQGKRVDFSLFLFWLKSFSLEVDADTGASYTRFVFAPATAGQAGVTYIPPQEGTSPGGGDPEPFPFPPIQPSSGFPLGTGRYIVIDNNNQLYYTASGNGITPVWTEVALSLTGTSIDFISDPHCPLYLAGSGDLWLRLTSTTRIYLLEVDTSDFTLAATAQKTLPSTTYPLRRIEMERGVPGFAAVASCYAASSTAVVTTTDGTNWGSEVTLNADAAAYGAPFLHVSGRFPGRILSSRMVSVPASTVGRRSDDSGASFGALTSPNLDTSGTGAYAGCVPWHNNASEIIAYFGWHNIPAVGSGEKRIYRVNGAAQTDISPTFGGSKAGAQFPRAIDTSPVNRLRVCAILRNGTDNATSLSDVFRVSYALDGAASASSWNGITALDGTVGGGNYYTGVRAFGDGSGFLAFGAAGQLALCDWNGNTRDISGNLAALGCGTILNIVGY